MSLRSPHHCLAAVLSSLLSLPMSAIAQTVEPDDSESLDPGSHVHPAPASQPDLSRAAETITTLTNQFRARNKRGELKVNAALTRTAREFAEYLARTDTFSHTADGKRPSQRVGDHGYRYCLVAENIAWEHNSAGYTTSALARAFVGGWRHSPDHRRNLLDADLDEIGVGVAYSEKSGRYYAVQDFGRPKSRAITFAITNDADAAIHYSVDGKSFTLEPHYTVTHQRCRPAELDFREAHARSDSREEGEETFHPRNGARFIVRGSRGDGYTVEERTR